MKKALIVLLVVVVLVTGMPILMGMSGMATCHDCGPAVFTGAACPIGILAGALALVLALLALRLRRDRGLFHQLLHSFLLERPPRLA